MLPTIFLGGEPPKNIVKKYYTLTPQEVLAKGTLKTQEIITRDSNLLPINWQSDPTGM